jgi:hypothetical protein
MHPCPAVILPPIVATLIGCPVEAGMQSGKGEAEVFICMEL